MAFVPFGGYRGPVGERVYTRDFGPSAADQVAAIRRLEDLRAERLVADAPVAGHVIIAEEVSVATPPEQITGVEQAA